MEQTSLISINRSSFSPEAHAIDHGAIIYSHTGSASVRINFDKWELNGESVLCFFPGDIIKWETMSDDFAADAILYSSDTLRSASLNVEHIIDEYIVLRLKLAMRTSKRSLKQIAADFHFSDQSALTRYFRTHVGMSPQQYRLK